MSPPDWNWADFCGVALLQAALNHRYRLSEDLRNSLADAITHAARAIQRRNVAPGYTNIAIMGTYVTLIAGELFELADLQQYGRARLRRFYEYTLQNGFTEYNSPTYTIVALKELARLRQNTLDNRARQMADELYQMAWQEIARHFHAPTWQWAGPHSRSYHTLLQPQVLALIQKATSGRVNFGEDLPTLDDCRLDIRCPRSLESFFTRLEEPRQFEEIFSRERVPLIGTTYLEPTFTLGTINSGDFWNQRRSLVAYWGTAKNPGYMHLRFLHDGFDFAAAKFYSVQQQGTVLGGVSFATDGGDRHPSLDKIKAATIRAKDLRARFEFGGASSKLRSEVAPSAGLARINLDAVQLQIVLGRTLFAGNSGHWEAGHDENTAWLDLVLYSGELKTFDLPKCSPAVLGFAVQLATKVQPDLQLTSLVSKSTLQLRLALTQVQQSKTAGLGEHGPAELSLEVPCEPDKAATLQARFHAAKKL
jgi:hypothetical protein